MSAAPKLRFSPEEYFALEEKAPYKSEYFDGEIFAMAGGTPEHGALAVNCAALVKVGLRGKPCQPYSSDVMVSVMATGLRTYPDLSVACGVLERDPKIPTAITNPSAIFEVVSPSTEAYDRGKKAENYRRIPSLKALVLIASTRHHVEVQERQADGSWHLRETTALTDSVAIASLGIELPMADLYEGVEMAAEQSGETGR